jgi:hypothetical protein
MWIEVYERLFRDSPDRLVYLTYEEAFTRTWCAYAGLPRKTTLNLDADQLEELCSRRSLLLSPANATAFSEFSFHQLPDDFYEPAYSSRDHEPRFDGGYS